MAERVATMKMNIVVDCTPEEARTAVDVVCQTSETKTITSA